jgi:hypothetical protein
MEVTSFLVRLDRGIGISRAIDNPHDVPIDLCILRHEVFDVWLWDPMPSHDVVEVMQENHLSIFVLGLEIAINDGYVALVGPIVYTASHGGYALDMVRHDPSMLKIPAKLHAPNQINPTTRANLRHLEDKDFVPLIPLA